MTSPETVVLTGERRIGKSTICSRTVALAQAHGHICGGIITLSHEDPNHLVDHRYVRDVRSGAQRRLTIDAVLAPHATTAAVVQGRFRFDPQAFAWAEDVLTRATPCHLLVVDELGPLEIQRGQGWYKALGVISENDFRLALVVIRPELVDQARLLLPNHSVTILTVTRHDRDALPNVILRMLERQLEIGHS